MLVVRSAGHVGVGIVMDGLNALLLCLTPCLGSLNAATKNTAYLLHYAAVGFGSLYLILTDGIVG